MKFNLEIKAQLENIGHFAPEDVDSFEWNIKFMCTECNEQKETFRVLSSETKYPNKSGKGESHLVETCHFCGRGGSVEILTDIKASYTDADEGKFVTIGSFECRGMEPVDFCFGGGFRVQAANSGTVFEPVDLSEKEWTDYDASAKEAVSIMELESRFVKRK